MEERYKLEGTYHDQKTISGNSLFYGYSQSPYYNFFYGEIGKIAGLRVIDLGCGDGWFSKQLIDLGAFVCGIDVSFELLKKAKKLNSFRNEEVGNFIKTPAEKLAFCNDSFDLIIGSAILHHTNLELSINEIYRVLKPGGRAIFIEPYNENIILKIWRRITPWRRSKDERALNDNDIKLIKEKFKRFKIRFFVLTSILSEGLFIFFNDRHFLRQIDRILSNFDKILINKLPLVEKYCAVVILDLKK